MEEVKMEVVSKCIVKPSSPTPPHLKHYQLSFLDQMPPSVYASLVLFYSTSSTAKTDIVLSRLKTSLSETLTLFYPLAGRHKCGNTFIDCNDQGIPFIETLVTNSRLSDVVQNPDPQGLHKFVPFVVDDLSDVIFGVQFNVFEEERGGGIAIGLCISHRIADGLSMFMFTKTWAAICRGAAADHTPPPPEFVSARLFPPVTDLEEPIESTTTTTKKKIFSKRFVFKPDVIEALKAKYSSSSSSPSRVGVLSAFIWSRIAAALHSDPAKPWIIIQTVNLRTRSEPPLPENSFGNLFRVVMTIYESPDAAETGSKYVDLIPKMQEAGSTIDAEFVRNLSKGEDQVYSMMKIMASQYCGDYHSKVNVITFSSLCRFPMYESDFGWGKPTWVGLPLFSVDNLVVFVDTKSGDGIEAYVNWKEEDIMAKLEKDVEFQTRISRL